MSLKRFLPLFCILLIALFLAACSTPSKQLETIQLHEVTRSVFYAPQYVAISKGFFEDVGMEVEITTSGGSDKAMTALLSGQADFCLAGPETAVYVFNEGKTDYPIVVGQLTKQN